MRLPTRLAWAGVCAVAASVCTSCGASRRDPTRVSVMYVSEPTCAANVHGAVISVTDAPEGASVIYETRSWDYVDVMRAQAQQQIQIQTQARASGGAPLDAAPMPAVQARIHPHPRGLFVTYTAGDPKDTERLRGMIWLDVQRQRRGECSRLRLPMIAPSPAVSSESPSER